MPIRYYRVDLTHVDAEAALDELAAAFATDYPSNALSVNRRKDGKLAWVKAVDGLTLPDGVVTQESDTAVEANAEIAASDWYPDA